MRIHIIPLLALLLVSGCGYKRLSRNDTREIATSNANTKVVAENLAKTPATQPHASILKDQAKVTDAVLNLDERQKAELNVQPTVSAEGLAKDAKAEADKSRGDTEERLEGIKEDHESGWWKWLTGGGIVTGLMAALGVASKLGLPGAGIAHAVGRMIAPKLVKQGEEKAEALEEKVAVASEAIVSSDIGRWGLKELDKRIPDGARDEIADIVSKLTKGHATSVDGLFTYLAKHHAIDSGKQGSVDSLLTELRGLLPTEGGLPSALNHLLDRES